MPCSRAMAMHLGRNQRDVCACLFLPCFRELYARDCRVGFCSRDLWLAPFLNYCAAHGLGRSGRAALTSPAVMRALLPAMGDGFRAAGGVPAPNWARGDVAASLPGALAELLLAAPQCVPFDARIHVFRALVAQDREA